MKLAVLSVIRERNGVGPRARRSSDDELVLLLAATPKDRLFIALQAARDFSHQPVFSASGFGRVGASGDASQVARTDMLEMKAARETVSSHIPIESTRHFDVALHGAIRSSLESMTELREAVFECVDCLRVADVGPAQMILAMKACALDSGGRYRPEGDEYPASNVDTLIEQIVRWSIIKYYS
jgi:hypothetical protein